MGGNFTSKPAVVCNPDTKTEEVFAVGTDGKMYHSYSANAGPWSNWNTINSGTFKTS
ncbi:hypothetical protein ACPC54_27230 [Kitasatospora sp. NPDC094028]